MRVFDEIIGGAQMIGLFARGEQVLASAKEGFVSVASYKLLVNNSKIIESVLCDFASTLIIAILLLDQRSGSEVEGVV